MARNKMFDPAFQKAFTDAIVKENESRRKWRAKYGTRYRPPGIVDWDEDPDEESEDNAESCHHCDPIKKKTVEKRVSSSSSAEGRPSSKTVQKKVSSSSAEGRPSSKTVQKRISSSSSAEGRTHRPSLKKKAAFSRTIPRVEYPPRVMLPVPERTKMLIYTGTSRDGDGKEAYLKQRYQKPPAKRFRFPIVSSWEYGWEQGKRLAEMSVCPRHGLRDPE